ncbi:MAG TPA: PAS domain S-box protein [Aliidongia sp.]|nr:PAS domain S-box protein [Aliidongia sp.]
MQQRRSPKTTVAGFVAAICLVLLSLTALQIWTDRRDALRAGRADTENLVRSISQQASDTLRTVDVTLLGVVERLEHDGMGPAQIDRLHRLMIDRIAQFPAIANFAIFDEHGDWVTTVVPNQSADRNNSDREYFRHHLDHDDRNLYIGAPIVGRASRIWNIPVTRRFNHSDGSFAGIVIGAIDMNYFLKFYDSFEIGQQGAIGLTRDDGILMTRRPFLESNIGRSLANGPLFHEHLPQAPAGAMESISPLDGITRLVSYRRVDNFPLVVVAALAKEEVLKAWRQDAWSQSTIVGFLVLAIAIVGARLASQIGRREQAERATAAIAEDYRLLAENSPNMVVRVGPDGIRRYVNEELEARVEARTQELSRLNQTLTEREAALRESTELLRATFDAAPFAIAVVALDHSVLSWNRTAEQMFGYAAEEMIGRQILDISPPEEKAETLERMTRVMKGEHLTDIERRRPRRDGTQIDVSLAMAPVFDAERRVRAVIYVVEDVTHKRGVEAQLRQAQKMEAIGNLTGGMAHDFNNLLGIVIGNLDILRSLRPGDADVEELGGEALDAALRGADLTRRLLAFARRQPLQPQHVDINALVSGIIALLGRVLGEDIEISLDLSGRRCLVKVDPAQLESALTNLANNARDAMPRGGRLIICTDLRHLDADYAAEHPDVKAGDYAMIEVSDTGSGIPASAMAHIFEPFFTTKERDRGSGLGLSMVFGFMKQSGGHINVYSEEGVGTTFRLYLPCVAEPAEAEEAARMQPIVPGQEETILVVEDNPALRKVVVRQLTALGYRIVEAGTGAEALAALEAGSVDLVFTDVILPGGMNGFQLAETIMARFPAIKIVLTSGFPEVKLEPALVLTNLRLLSKPYRKEDLARVLREVLTE